MDLFFSHDLSCCFMTPKVKILGAAMHVALFLQSKTNSDSDITKNRYRTPFSSDVVLTITFTLWKWTLSVHMFILINIESGLPDFDLGYPILEPAARVGYLDWILGTYSISCQWVRVFQFHLTCLSILMAICRCKKKCQTKTIKTTT